MITIQLEDTFAANLLAQLHRVEDEGPPGVGWKSDVLDTFITTLEKAVTQGPEAVKDSP